MLQKVGPWLLSILILCVAATSLAQVTRHAFEAVDTEDLSVELRDGELMQGQVRHVDDERAVLLSEDGEVREVLLKDVAHLRVKPKTGEDATERAKKRVDESIKAAEDAEQSAPQRTPSTGYVDERSSGYLSSSDASTESPFMRAYEDHATAHRSQRLTLSAIDYGHYQTMIRGSRVKRVIGWTLVATGAVLLAGAIYAANEARRYGDEFENEGFVIFGALHTLTGLPVAIAGRQQYRRAAEFAEEAAKGRASIDKNRQATDEP